MRSVLMESSDLRDFVTTRGGRVTIIGRLGGTRDFREMKLTVSRGMLYVVFGEKKVRLREPVHVQVL